ncbi:DUF559 domain-containing protein [Candidatus Kaiserbacteria bacterium]|nr:DUF559 domain-containing protein [Candidatus Kaiserbacteria bacterium]USN92068.1 MAG: DUF559 domain-containing protein [Candidatus Nomurabacteria bacterium]
MEEENISQVKIEEVFIKSLLDKLKVGNRRGIHLNAIPGRARSRLDLAELDEIRDGLSKEFLDKLLNEESFEFAINFEGINFTEIEEKQKEKLDFIARKLNNISIDDEDQYLESGIRNFGFGYPLLIRRDQTDPEKVVKAPLLIWNLDIEKSNRKQSHWTVKKNPERCAHINQLLRSHVLRDSQISIDALDAEYLDDNVVDESELFEICEKILSQINTQSSSIDIKGLRVEKCPTGNKLDGLATDEAWIQWSGVFGIFTSQKESVIRQAEKMLKELPAFQDQKLVLDKFQTSTVSSVATDPSKEEIINTLTDNEVKLIQGPPGTGKSQALTAIITNVLENGGKCLVVCEKRTALQVIHRNLSKLKLDNMCALIDDVSKDRTTIVKKARSVVENTQDYGTGLLHGEKKNYENKFQEFCRLRDSFNRKHTNERNAQIDEVSWKDSIGEFLHASNEVSWDGIKNNFPKKFVLADEEYIEFETVIKDASHAYVKLQGGNSSAFLSLDKKIYDKPFSRQASDELLESLNDTDILVDELSVEIDDLDNDNIAVSGENIFDLDALNEVKNRTAVLLDRCNASAPIVSGFLKSLQSVELIVDKPSLFEDTLSLDDIKPSEIKPELKRMIEVVSKDLEYLRSMEEFGYRLVTSVNTDRGANFEPVDRLETIVDGNDTKASLKICDEMKNALEGVEEKLTLLLEENGTDSLALDFSDKTIGLFRSSRSSTKRKKELRALIPLCSKLLIGYEPIETSIETVLSESGQQLKENIDTLKNDLALSKKLISSHKKILKVEKKLNRELQKFIADEPLDFIEVDSIEEYKEYVKAISDKIALMKNEFGLYQSVHEWGYFYKALKTEYKEVISGIIKSQVDTSLWLSAVRAWRYYYLLQKLESNSDGFNTDNSELERLLEVYNELKREQVKILQYQWAQDIRRNVGTNFRILYNLRKNNTHSRTNSLRKIIHEDFEQFTSIFPVILTNPLAADSMLPLELGLFDVVIFDEASQLRTEDTFTSFVRGKYKVIAGDKHQMPPSNYFQREGDVKDSEDYTDEELQESERARSESLLDYAETLGYSSQSYLDFHYRSQHPALIDFSNVAFYGGNLVPFPERFAYTPIKFIEVNGVFEKAESRQGKVNYREIDEVVRILREEITSNPDGTFPSVGIATFNISQRDSISDRINEEMIKDSSFATKIEKIKESDNGLFIKNLENIQGDEMDVVIISTTYGNDQNGKFYERFGPLLVEKAYKLLNVLITRARDKVYICTSIPQNKYSSYSELLDQYGNNRRAILYAYLSYAKAISESNLEDADSIKEDLLRHSHDQPRTRNSKEGLIESPFEQEVFECLIERIDEKFVTPQKRIGGFRVDFLVEIGDRKIVIECDGKTYHSSNEAYSYDMFRQRELENLGFDVYRIWSTKWWHNHTQEINKLVTYLDTVS